MNSSQASFVAVMLLAGLFLWGQLNLSRPISAAPAATTMSGALPFKLKPSAFIAPLVSGQAPAQPGSKFDSQISPFVLPRISPTPNPTPFFLIHTVRAGETLISIAAYYQVATEKLLAANDIRDPTHLKEGQKLLVPPDQKLYICPGIYPIVDLTFPLHGGENRAGRQGQKRN